MSVSGFAQINKHSFGANINNGILYIPQRSKGINYITNEEDFRPAKFLYVFGIGGSYLNSTNKWLAWRTNFNLAATSRSYDSPELIDGELFRYSFRDFFSEFGFGPMFTYQKEDFGIYLGGTLDLMHIVRHTIDYDRSSVIFDNYPFPTPSAYIGYWQRVGNINSPWFLEITLMRRVIAGLLNLIESRQIDNVYYTLNIGFRYELNR